MSSKTRQNESKYIYIKFFFGRPYSSFFWRFQVTTLLSSPPLNMKQISRIHAYFFSSSKNKKKHIYIGAGARIRVLKLYISSNVLVMGIPISFNTGLLSRVINPAWYLLFDLSPSRTTYRNRRFPRGLSTVSGRVGRVVLMVLHTHRHKEHRHRMERKKKASLKLFLNASRPRFLCLAQRQWVTGTNGFCFCVSFLFRVEFYAVDSWNAQATSGASTRFQNANVLLLRASSLSIFSSRKA